MAERSAIEEEDAWMFISSFRTPYYYSYTQLEK
jgi:hypothetical protein